jgi:hypothetical protein
VPQAGDWEELGDALQQPEDDCLEIGDRIHAGVLGPGRRGAGILATEP